MADEQKNPSTNNDNKSSSSSSSSSSSCSKEKMKKVSSSTGEIPIGSKGGSGSSSSSSFSDHYPNQRETSIPDAATLRDQWRFAIRQYSKWSSYAWGAAIFAGVSFYALGWIIKGSDPIPSSTSKKQPQAQDQEDDHK